jgi:hypothetical protein
VKLRYRTSIGAASLLSVVLFTLPAHGEVIFESALLGPTGQTGGALIGTLTPGSDQLLGARFHIDDEVHVVAVGGHLSEHHDPGRGSLFAAIVPLGGSSAFPTGSPIDDTTLAVALFMASFFSTDLLVPLSLTLAPGDYALIFGSNRFGATGFGVMPTNNADLFGIAPYFFWDPPSGEWRNTTSGGLRFVVSGEAIPESSTLSLLVVGTLGLLVCAGRRAFSALNR